MPPKSGTLDSPLKGGAKKILPLTREVAKSLILTEGEIVFLLTKSLPQSASQTAPSSEGAKENTINLER